MNTRDGAVEKNLVSNTAERVSKQTEDAVLKKEVSPEFLAQISPKTEANIHCLRPTRTVFGKLILGQFTILCHLRTFP